MRTGKEQALKEEVPGGANEWAQRPCLVHTPPRRALAAKSHRCMLGAFNTRMGIIFNISFPQCDSYL